MQAEVSQIICMTGMRYLYFVFSISLKRKDDADKRDYALRPKGFLLNFPVLRQNFRVNLIT